MPEAAAAPAAAPAAPSATPAAGAGLTSVPTGEWASGFQNQEIKSYITQKGFKSPEALAESYKSLETKLSSKHPVERTIFLPEKMEGDAAREVWEKLGAPKEAKEYGFARLEKGDNSVTDWAENTFHKLGIPKSQAIALKTEYDNLAVTQMQSAQKARDVARTQDDAKLRAEWGAQYEANENIVRQGVKILGLDEKQIDLMEAVQGREALYKNLFKIGVAVGEAPFADGSGAKQPDPTPEQASDRIKQLMTDQKFMKKFNRGDTEALAEWTKLNQLAAPGEKQIG